MARSQSTASDGNQDAGALEVGSRLREYRRLRRVTLRAVAERAGVTEGFLSQFERGLTNASLATTRRIVGALGLEMADLFASDRPVEPTVSGENARPTLRFGHRVTKQLLTPRPFRHLEVFIGTFEPGGMTGPEPLVHGHSQELIYILEGKVCLELGDRRLVMSKTDCIEYDSGTPHRFTEIGGATAKVLWVISPPSY